MRKLLLQRAQTKRSNREGNEKESQQLLWMRLTKSRKNKLKQNKKSSTVIEDEEKKEARNLYKALTNDSKSVFYATSKNTKNFGKKSKKLII